MSERSSCHNREVETIVVHVSCTIGRVVVASRYKSSVKTKPVREPTIFKPSNTTTMVSKQLICVLKPSNKCTMLSQIAGNFLV